MCEIVSNNYRCSIIVILLTCYTDSEKKKKKRQAPAIWSNMSLTIIQLSKFDLSKSKGIV